MHNRRTIVSPAIVIKQRSDKNLLYSEWETFSDAMWQTDMKTYFARIHCHSFSDLTFFPTSAYLAISLKLSSQSLSPNLQNLSSCLGLPSFLPNIVRWVIPCFSNFCNSFSVCKWHWRLGTKADKLILFTICGHSFSNNFLALLFFPC